MATSTEDNSAVAAGDQPQYATGVDSTIASETASTPAPYGTRSRNRGAPRPNYAEDNTEIDTELEQSLNTKSTSSKRSSMSNQNNRTASPTIHSDKTSGVSTRRANSSSNGNVSSAKEGIPGTSTFSANPNVVVGSRKRKQPGSSTTVQTATTPVNQTSVVTKKYVASGSRSDEPLATNMMSFKNSRGYLKNGKLKADDGTVLGPNDHVYLICEPPGEPYYLARIMEFLPSKDDPKGPIESIRVNWYYRPRDIQRKANDLRCVYASMHSDACPLTSLRGKCTILHKTEIDNWDEYQKAKDSFWFERMYDRYIHRYYDVIPTSRVINVPEPVKKVLDERWRFVLVEVGRRKELTSEVKKCIKCNLYAASTNSVDCAVCQNTYHMLCVRPVLQKKPARGFAWACGSCSRAQDNKLKARDTPILGESRAVTEREVVEEDEEEPAIKAIDTQQQNTPSPNELAVQPATSEHSSEARLWPFRYLGIHCKVEDALDYDDRIYPRASSRLGTRHQANVVPWFGHTVEYVKPPEVKRKYMKSGPKRELKLSKEALAAQEAERAERANRPKWVLDEPPGYITRGEDGPITVGGKQIYTAELQFKMPDASQLPSRGEDDAPGSHLNDADREKFIDEYMEKAKEIAPSKGLEKFSTNFLDKALKFLYEENFNEAKALERLEKVDKYKDLKEPHLRPEQLKLFESGVAKYGSELRNITRHIGTVKHRDVVRFYYMWKKTPKGRQIWGNFAGRKGKKLAKKVDNGVKLLDDVADDHDDSAFDNDKAMEKKRGFTCKFCFTKSSRQWRRAPGVPPGTTIPVDAALSKRDKITRLTVSLCQRCAVLWRKYGIEYEDPDEIAKRISQGGNKSWRRRHEEGLLAQILTTSELDVKINQTTAAIATGIGVHISTEITKDNTAEPPKKKNKNEKEVNSAAVTQALVEQPKKKSIDKPLELLPLPPDTPKIKILPCFVCDKMEPVDDQHLTCRDCRLTVHRDCYGVGPDPNAAKWICDMCSNDKTPVISTTYECILCPVTHTEHELMEPPRISHKRKSDREREKERVEREMISEASKLYRHRQEAAGKPIGPREPLKRTAGNNWVHVSCAIWVPEIKFGNAKELEPAEGLESIPQDSFKDKCKICKTDRGACVPCRVSTCNARFHVGCAHQAGYPMGFDVTPIKSSRKDAIATAKLGDETGIVTPAIWCASHNIQTKVHGVGEPTAANGINALQLYARTFKQADLTLTGTARKAAFVQQSTQTSASASHRRAATNGVQPIPISKEITAQASAKTNPEQDPSVQSKLSAENAKMCYRCQSAVSPKWWPVKTAPHVEAQAADHHMRNGIGPASTHNDVDMIMNGDLPADNRNGSRPGIGNAARTPKPTNATVYECHKCHFKKTKVIPAEPSNIPRPQERETSLQPVRLPEFPHHQYPASPHTNQVQLHGGMVPPLVPVGRPHSTPEWRPEYDQRPADYGNHLLRKGISPSPLPSNGLPLAPPPGYHPSHQPPPARMNGYSLPPPLPPAFTNGAPPPTLPPPHQPYPTHQSPYGPIPVPVSVSGPPPPPHTSHPYPNPASQGMHLSPPTSISSLAASGPNSLPPPSRLFSVDRQGMPNLPSPSASRRTSEIQRPGPTGLGSGSPEQSKTQPSDPSAATRPRGDSLGRRSSVNGSVPAVSGASASPSLKNLLL
ncbi:putative PHD type zinc finger protein with BAH domain-containing protein [Myotisia sp. PD_48]|nr:putative PHD type zinc finger protein with BAH domain-containing protein [Myotisia sp. PD_48]